MGGINNLLTDFKHSDLLVTDDIAVVRFAAETEETRLDGEENVEWGTKTGTMDDAATRGEESVG